MFNMTHEIFEGGLMRKLKDDDDETKSNIETNVLLSGD